MLSFQSLMPAFEYPSCHLVTWQSAHQRNVSFKSRWQTAEISGSVACKEAFS